MDWSAPTAALIPGLEGVALYRLYQVKTPQSATEVHRRAGVGSLNGLRNALERMADQGVVDTIKVGNAIGYRLNEDHVVYPALAAAFDELDPFGVFTSRLRMLVEAHFPPGPPTPKVSLAIYGSAARREASSNSDVDLLIVLPDDALASVRSDVLTDDLHQWVPRWTGNTAHVYRTTRSALAASFRAEEPLTRSWAKDAITVTGADVRDLMRASA